MSLIHCLLSLLLFLVSCHAEDPTWPTSCKFTRYSGKWPRVLYRYRSSRDPEWRCRERCAGDSRCGMYTWWWGRCELYQTSLELMSQVMGVEEEEMMETHSGWNVGSKKCEGLEHDHSHCPTYTVQYDDEYPRSRYEILYVSSYRTSLTAAQCQALCSSYSRCRSVGHRVYSTYSSYCYLYSTTITELRRTWKENEVYTSTGPGKLVTYERYCGERPYYPLLQ